ncbi:ATP-binding protein [Streptomyces sp. NRRL S-350]|uniref:ATP-binding protein n=1 Tax=Streptomyces sp. NRRL S-350 TaxID=1463902 RepID=UPI00131C569F|nr:ATP-binding protein [Streptomyces sp. NRRL S-350]
MPQTLRLPLADRPGAAGEARAVTARFLADVPDRGVVSDAVLLVSELVGNAQRHTAGPGALLLVRDTEALRIEVTDTSPRPPVPRMPYESSAPGGLGLFLVIRLSRAWGWRPDGPGKTVWCELRLPAR